MRSHYCGNLGEGNVEQQVTLCGWVHRRRDHGGVIFIDLRDKTGLAQVVFAPECEAYFKIADKVRSEYVIKISGVVRLRPAGMTNANLASGAIEINGQTIEIFNASLPLPFQLDGPIDASEEVRLTYRYLELRRPELQKNLFLRARANSFIRQFLEQEGFVDIETPILTRATPEGARDYIVPSRIYPGNFFALPQSPQLFKQLLMVAGFDRYYQIARCFRDEDLRADRQPEFTQIDIEASFVDEKAIMSVAENLVRGLFETLLSVSLPKFEVMTYDHAMNHYGSDKPDLRIPMTLVDISDLVKQTTFKVFKAPAESENGKVAVLKVPKGAELSRKQLDEYTKFVGIFGAKGLAWVKINAIEKGTEGLQSPILKFLDDGIIQGILNRVKAQNGDILFFGADTISVVHESLGALRSKVGHDLNLYQRDYAPLWVTEFPMFEKNKQGDWTSLHHPFTSPNCTPEMLVNDPAHAKSRAYDMVLNGVELGGGSIRIHDQEMQKVVFNILDIEDAEQKEKFGFLLNALKYGAPPHGGIAFGLDRLVMLMCGATSIKEVIAFPKTQSSSCSMTKAPSCVQSEQLDELKLFVMKETS